jgi:hypothetical protein
VEAAWLAAYQAAGVPVLAELSTDQVVDDPLGPPWWVVWMLAGAQSGAGMSLTDVLKPIVSASGPVSSDGEATEAVFAMLGDLATARDAGDQTAGFVAAFLDVKVGHPGVVSLFDPALDPITTTVDLSTAYMVQWVVVRGLASTVIDATSAAVPAPEGSAAPQGLVRRLAGGAPCSEFWGSEDVTFITNTLISKVLGGVAVPGVKFTGLIEKVVDLNSGVISKSAFERGTAVISKVNVATSLASLLMQYLTIEVGGAFDTLERTKTTTDGKQITNRIDLSVDPGKLPDQNLKALCALSGLLNGAGVSFSLPAAGPLTGVEVTLSNGASIPDRVLFANANQLKQDTDGTGSITFDLIGKAQEKELPDSAKQVDLEYGVVIEATGEPISGNSIFNTFFDSLTASTAGAVGFVAPAIDIAKTVHWDLGEHFGPLTDWEQASYRIDQAVGELHFTGVVCGLDKPFTLTSADPAPGSITYTPSGPAGGSYFGSGQVGTTQGSLSWSGTYSINVADPAHPTIRMDEGTTTIVNIPVIGQAPLPGFWAGGVTFDLVLAPEACSDG